jgi:hypothetical protein
MIPFAHNDMKMRLAPRSRLPDPRLEDILGLFDILPMEIDGILRDAARRVILAKDELRGLLVVRRLLRLVVLALIRERFRLGAVAAEVGVVGLEGVSIPSMRICIHTSMIMSSAITSYHQHQKGHTLPYLSNPSTQRQTKVKTPYLVKTRLLLIPFTPRQIPQPIILHFRIIARTMVEGCTPSPQHTYVSPTFPLIKLPSAASGSE